MICDNCIHKSVCINDHVADAEVMAHCKDYESLRKFGEWVKITGMAPPEYHGRHMCSLCGKFALHDKWHEVLSNYCPYCGATMNKENV